MTKSEVGIRELKQNPSEVISLAEAGTTFTVLRNGKRTSVVIRSESAQKSRWVTAAALEDALSGIEPDEIGWLEELDRSRDNDPIVDPHADRG